MLKHLTLHTWMAVLQSDNLATEKLLFKGLEIVCIYGFAQQT